MSRVGLLCAVVAATFAVSCAFAAPKRPADPYAVAPRTTDWLCAMNTADLAQVYLTNAGLIDQTKVDFHQTEVQLLLKKSLGAGRFEQVFFMTLRPTGGKPVSIVTVSTTESDGECPGTDGVKVYVVSQELGKLPSLDWVIPRRK